MNYYSLIIADDEKQILDGLQYAVDWHALGYEIVKSCLDGQEVIDYLNEKQQVEVILADYKMLNISGIEVARYVKERNLPIKIVLLTGYAEFQIAQQAIQYGVNYYMLKPTDFDEMVEIFQEIKLQLDSKYILHYKEELFTSGLKDVREDQLFDIVMPADHIELDSLKRNIMTVLLHIRQFYVDNLSMNMEELKEDILYEKVLKTMDKGEILEYYKQMITEFILKREDSGGYIVKCVKKYVEGHIEENILLSDISDTMYLNTTYISRVFSQTTGETFSNYLIRIKMEYAMELLKKPQLKIYEVGAKVGYHDMKNFYRQFKRVTGLTPSEYRNKTN